LIGNGKIRNTDYRLKMTTYATSKITSEDDEPSGIFFTLLSFFAIPFCSCQNVLYCYAYLKFQSSAEGLVLCDAINSGK